MAGDAFDASWWVTGAPTYLARRKSARIEGAEAQALAQRLAELHFFDLPADLDQGRAMPDATGFGVTVSDGARSHTVEFSGASGGQGLSDLLHWLDAHASAG